MLVVFLHSLRLGQNLFLVIIKLLNFMKILAFSFAVLIVMFLTTSCKDQNAVEQSQSQEASISDYLFFLSSNLNKYNLVQVYGSIVGDNKFAGGSIQVVTRTTDPGLNHSDFKINNTVLTGEYTSRGTNSTDYTYTEKNNQFHNLFGQDIVISLTRSHNAAAKSQSEGYKDYTIYNPKLVGITNFEPIVYFSTSNDLLFEWVPDTNNEKRPIFINMKLRSVGKDEILPSKNVSFSKIVDDTGSFSVKAADLSVFPDESKVDIMVYRGNAKLMDDNVIAVYSGHSIAAFTTTRTR